MFVNKFLTAYVCAKIISPIYHPLFSPQTNSARQFIRDGNQFLVLIFFDFPKYRNAFTNARLSRFSSAKHMLYSVIFPDLIFVPNDQEVRFLLAILQSIKTCLTKTQFCTQTNSVSRKFVSIHPWEQIYCIDFRKQRNASAYHVTFSLKSLSFSKQTVAFLKFRPGCSKSIIFLGNSP